MSHLEQQGAPVISVNMAHLFTTLVFKNLIQSHRKRLRYLESNLKRRRILTLLYGENGLAGNTDGIGEGLLGHFAIFKPEFPDVIADGGLHLSSRDGSRRSVVRNSLPAKRIRQIAAGWPPR